MPEDPLGRRDPSGVGEGQHLAPPAEPQPGVAGDPAKVVPLHPGTPLPEGVAPASPVGDGRVLPSASWLDAARAEAAEIEYQCCYHAKAQFEACAVWERKHMRLGLVAAVLGALTASAVVSTLGDAGVVARPAAEAAPAEAVASLVLWAKWLLAVGALLAGVVAASIRSLDPQGRAGQHGAAAKRYTALADEARQFRTLVATAETPRADLAGQLQAMIKRRADIHEAAPVIPEKAVVAVKAKMGGEPCQRRMEALRGGRPSPGTDATAPGGGVLVATQVAAAAAP